MKRLALFLLIGVVLSGCGTTPGKRPVNFEVVSQLPQYRVGDTFIFDDGNVEKVVAIRGEKVDWESRGGNFRYTTYRNFVVPKLQWETEKKRVTLQYSQDRDILWPLQEGGSAYLSTIISVHDRINQGSKSYIQSWRCGVEGSYRIEVAAGTFDTRKVECQRSTLTGKWMQTRIWYYAPSVGHYVLREDEYAPTSSRRHIERRRELMAVIPSDQQFASGPNSPELHFQQTLESFRSGEESEWRDEQDRYSRRIRMMRSFRTTEGHYCREYQMKRRDDGRFQDYQGTACRGEDGRWRIAVARPGSGQG